jgi:tripartite-type tricarboxylate transporter receptor subunit TctC
VYFVMLPEGTPGSIVSDVHARVQAALEDPETREQIRAVGAEPAQRLTTAQAREWLAPSATNGIA